MTLTINSLWNQSGETKKVNISEESGGESGDEDGCSLIGSTDKGIGGHMLTMDLSFLAALALIRRLRRPNVTARHNKEAL